MDKEVGYKKIENKIRESLQKVHYLIRFPKRGNNIYIKGIGKKKHTVKFS